jgi:hypothetical protein
MASNATVETVGAVNPMTRGDAAQESEYVVNDPKLVLKTSGQGESLLDGVKRGPYLAPQVPHEVTDIARLRVAVERLRADGYVVLDGGCCPSCNWGQIRAEYPDAHDVVQFNDQCLDAAFGEMEPTPEWRGYLDAAGHSEEESERRCEEWLNHWGDDECPAAQRPGMLSDSLWIQHAGDAARAVEIIRSAGLNAVWEGDKDIAIEVRPRVGDSGMSSAALSRD